MNLFRLFGSGPAKGLSAEEEKQLMAEIKKADSITHAERQFSKLYDSMSGKLWNVLVRKFNNNLDVEDLRDSFQEGWRKVLEHRKDYIEGSNVYNWIYTIIKNTTFDFSRKDKKFLNEFEILEKSNVNDGNDENDDKGLFSLLANDEPTIEDEIEAKEIIEIIHEAINSLENEDERILIQRRILDEQKFSDIAEDLGIPIATVHYRTSQAMAKLRVRLEKLLNS